MPSSRGSTSSRLPGHSAEKAGSVRPFLCLYTLCNVPACQESACTLVPLPTRAGLLLHFMDVKYVTFRGRINACLHHPR